MGGTATASAASGGTSGAAAVGLRPGGRGFVAFGDERPLAAGVGELGCVGCVGGTAIASAASGGR
ncbi:MAG: hypothetical protein CMH59_20200, partial [Myxococcales bacterium]|nr:hypothetical protein [Myxococcales bacterium]